MYKIENKKRFLLFILAIAAILIAAVFGWKKYQAGKNNPENQPQVFEAMIQTKGQGEYKTDEDKKTFFENGDVLVIFPEGHVWSNGEKGETIIKLKVTKEEADRLMESEMRKSSEVGLRKDGEGEPQEETVRLRKYKVDLDDIDIDEPEKVYGSGVIEEK